MYDAARKFVTTALITLLITSTTILAQGMAGDRTTSSATQTVSVEVPTVVRLQRPSSRTVTMNASDPASFRDTQSWGVVSNSTSGARMTLSARSLTGDTNPSRKVPVRLRLIKERGDNWTMPRPTDSSSSGKAMVRAQSNGPGHASFRLRISIDDTETSDLQRDTTYSTTVVGTVRKR
jgi:hypothetical protein